MRKNEKRPRKRVRLLIVDDSSLIRQRLSALCLLFPRLEVVGEARDGLEALEMIRRLKPDVVTLDLRMPKINGFAVLERLTQERLRCTVIILSAIMGPGYGKKCLELGAHHVFDKTADFDKLLRLLAQL